MKLIWYKTLGKAGSSEGW